MNTVKSIIAKLVAEGLIVEREVTLESTVKGSAAHKDRRLSKVVCGSFHIGKEYLPPMGDGEPGDGRKLPWGEWESYPYVIRHNDTEYLRLTPVEGDRPAVAFMVDGEKVTREEFAGYLTTSEGRKLFESRKPECISVKVDNIWAIR